MKNSVVPLLQKYACFYSDIRKAVIVWGVDGIDLLDYTSRFCTDFVNSECTDMKTGSKREETYGNNTMGCQAGKNTIRTGNPLG